MKGKKGNRLIELSILILRVVWIDWILILFYFDR